MANCIQLYSMEIKYREAWFVLSAQTKEKLKDAFYALNPGVCFDARMIQKTKVTKVS
tara:strand:+ start:205 stop:375 length:171 start_codon:yes stop_codon:yes gene_type:complete